mmetsp:Transcript_26259/g.36159  ORF Transcript_26259/g.36159 Transcript_26259/m.36159 type:complete len:154 (-) Transcript_26259:88-549(-)
MASGDPFLLFIDTKSAEIAMAAKQSPAPLAQLDMLPKKGKKLALLLKIANDPTTLTDVKKGSIAEALKEGRYLYVYFNTGLRETYGFENHTLHLGGKDAKSFLSFCEEFYILNRVSTQHPKKKIHSLSLLSLLAFWFISFSYSRRTYNSYSSK